MSEETWSKRDIVILNEPALIQLAISHSWHYAERGGKHTRRVLGWAIAELLKCMGSSNSKQIVERIIDSY